MKDFERLTDKNDLYWALQETKLSAEVGIYLTDCLNRLADFEDKIEQGTLIELPCKVGDTVYMLTQVVVDFISYKREWRVHRFQVDNICINDDGDFYARTEYEKNLYFGRDVFLTREEALEKIKELQE